MESYIEEIEISPNSRASCKICNRKIKKGTPRGVTFEKDSRFGTYSKYYCYWCSKKLVEELKKHTKVVEKELNEIYENCKKSLIVEGLDNQ